jgi:hypothetical protein
MGCALEDVFVALNAADWQQPAGALPRKPAGVSRRLQLRAQVTELVDMYSLERVFGRYAADSGLLLDALCLVVRQLLGVTNCWLLNGPVVMGASQVRGKQAFKLLPEYPVGVALQGHADLWQALKTTKPADSWAYAVDCPLFRQSGGALLVVGPHALPVPLLQALANVVSASIRLQHQLWQMADVLDTANESELQHYRTELTEWILALVDSQQQFVAELSQYVCQRHGLPVGHPMRVAELAQKLAQQLGWSEDTIEAVYLAGVQVALEGVQWSQHLVDGQRTWTATDKQLAKSQGHISWQVLGQFLPLVELPGTQWTPDDAPEQLLQLVRQYCALTESRAYRKGSGGKQGAKPANGADAVCRRDQALAKLTAHAQQGGQCWPTEWLDQLQVVTA